MKKIETPRTVYDVTYESKDGKVFPNERLCKEHEEKLDFNNFKLEKEKLQGHLTKENWKHYMYQFLQLFAEYPAGEAQLLQEYTFEEIEYEKGKTKNKGFKLENVKKYFAGEFFHIHSYEDEFRRNNWNNGYGPRHDTRRLYKKDIDFVSLYKFMFETGLLSLQDVIRKQSFLEEEDEETIVKDKMALYDFLFYTSFRKDSTEMMDISIKYLGLDMVPFLTKKKRNSFGGGSRNMKFDFISSLAVSKSDEYGSKGKVDDFKRVKWIKYFLSKDLPIQLFRYSTTTIETGDDGKNWYTGTKEGKEKMIHYPISELVNEIRGLKNNEQIYLFKSKNEEVAKLFENNCGPNFINANKNNKLPEYLELAIKSCDIFKEIYAEYPDIQIIEDRSDYFKFSRVVSENMSIRAKNSHDNREAEEVSFEFVLNVLNQVHENKKDICIVRLEEKKTRYSRDKQAENILQIYNLKDFVGKPEKLAMELAYQLNLGSPLGLTAVEKISEIDAKLFEIEKKKQALEKEQQVLDSLKKEVSVSLKKKS